MLMLTMTMTAQPQAYSQSPERPQDVFRAFMDKMNANTLLADVTVTESENGKPGTPFTAHLKMRGKRFYVSMMGNEAAYDGHTFYIYMKESNELTLSVPDKEELLEVNPMLVAEEMGADATVRFVQTKKTDRYILSITPPASSGMTMKVTITLRKDDLMPLSITVTEGKNQTTFRFTKTSFTETIPSFVVQKKGATKVDLR